MTGGVETAVVFAITEMGHLVVRLLLDLAHLISYLLVVILISLTCPGSDIQ